MIYRIEEEKPINEENEVLELAKDDKILIHVLNYLDWQIKRDYPTKLSCFFTGVSAFLKEPLNLFLKGPSSIGKSYNATRSLRPFPSHAIWKLGGLSPTALVHLHGVLMSKDGEEIDLDEKPTRRKIKLLLKEELGRDPSKEEVERKLREEVKLWREKLRESYYLVDLTGKILLFLEPPHPDTFHRLYPILSHDAYRISYRFTEKTKRGGFKTTHVVIQGWPATIFLSTDKKYTEELSTRSFTATPEESAEKYRAANRLTTRKAALPWQYSKNEFEEKLRLYLARMEIVMSNKDVLIPFLGLEEAFPAELPRDMRDYQHFIQFVKAITALHYLNRPYLEMDGKGYIIASAQDVIIAMKLYYHIFETTRTGLDKQLLDFYHKIIKTKELWYAKELTVEYNRRFRPPRSEKTIKRYLQVLSDVGYVNVRKDDEDRRLNIYEPLVKEEEKGSILPISEMSTFLTEILEKGLEEWRKEMDTQTGNIPIYPNYRERENPLSWEEFKKKILSVNWDVVSIFDFEEESVKAENKPEKMDNSEMSRFEPNSNSKAISLWKWASHE